MAYGTVIQVPEHQPGFKETLLATWIAFHEVHHTAPVHARQKLVHVSGCRRRKRWHLLVLRKLLVYLLLHSEGLNDKAFNVSPLEDLLKH